MLFLVSEGGCLRVGDPCVGLVGTFLVWPGPCGSGPHETPPGKGPWGTGVSLICSSRASCEWGAGLFGGVHRYPPPRGWAPDKFTESAAR